MRLRILVVTVGTVAAALVLAGLGTLALARASTLAEAEDQLRSVAEGVVELPGDVVSPDAGPAARRAALGRLLDGVDVDGIDFVAIGPAGRVTGTLPVGVPRSALDVDDLRAGLTLSGRTGSRVWAAAPLTDQRGGVLLAVLTRTVDVRDTPAVRWFLLAAPVSLLLAALAAWWLSGALTAPLRRAEVATHRIAAGDLATRLPAPDGQRADEVGDLTRSINAMAAELERSRGLERQFLLSVSHDLRTPLTSIRGWAEAIEDGAAPDPTAAARVVQAEARRLERLVSDLLDLARLDAHRFALDPAHLPVAAIVAATAEGFVPDAAESGISLAIQGDEGAVALVDPDRLSQVVANLLENALKHARSSIAVTTGRVGDEVVVSVADDGVGIAAEDLPHVFERLYVAGHRPVRRESGSGLGLAICRELVALMGGRIEAVSPDHRTGTGTVLTLTLPATGAVSPSAGG